MTAGTTALAVTGGRWAERRTWPGPAPRIDLDARRRLAADVLGLRAALLADGVSRVVLIGTGLVPRVAAALCRDAGTDLVVLDTLDPTPVVDALAGDLTRTVLVVLADGPVARVVSAALAANGIDPLNRTVWVGAGAPDGVRVRVAPWDADPAGTAPTGASPLGSALPVDGVPVDGVLGAGVIVAAGLAGVELDEVLDDAEDAQPDLDPSRAQGPLAALGTALDAAGGIVAVHGAADLAEVVDGLFAGRGVVLDHSPALHREADPLRLHGSLVGRLLLLAAAADLLDPAPAVAPPSPTGEVGREHRDVAVTLRSAGLGDPSSLGDALAALLEAEGHLHVRAHLDPTEDASASLLRGELARRCAVPVTLAWGAGAGPAGGTHLVLSGDPEQDVALPDGSASLGELARVRTHSDAAALAHRGTPVLWVHLDDRLVGLAQLVGAIQQLEVR